MVARTRWVGAGAVLVLGCSPGPKWYAVPADIAGVRVPTALAGICRPGPPRWPNPDSTPTIQPPARSPGEASFETILGGDDSHFPGPMRCIIRTEAEWRTLWASRDVPSWAREDVPPLANVVFGRDMLIVATLGPQPSRSLEVPIMVRDVRVRPEGIVIVVQQTAPAGCISLPEATTPAHVVRMPRIDRPVRFVELLMMPHVSC